MIMKDRVFNYGEEEELRMGGDANEEEEDVHVHVEDEEMEESTREDHVPSGGFDEVRFEALENRMTYMESGFKSHKSR